MVSKRGWKGGDWQTIVQILQSQSKTKILRSNVKNVSFGFSFQHQRRSPAIDDELYGL